MAKTKCPECGNQGKLAELSFRPAEGGAISEGRMEHKRSGQGGGPGFDYHHFTTVHPSLSHAVNHLKNHLAPAFPQGARENEGPGTEGEAGEEEE